MSTVEILDGTIDLVKTLSVNSEKILLSEIENWENLTDEQKIFISAYFDNFPNESLASLRCKTPYSRVKKWKSDKGFLSVFEFVKTLYTDALASIHFHDSISNSRNRGTVLKQLKARDYDEKPKVAHQTMIINGMKEAQEFLSSRSS